MAELKTKKNEGDVLAFLNAIEDEQKKKDSLVILEKMKKWSKSEPKMWGSSIIGFGDHHYKYASGREGDWFVIGFSPRKQAITIYLMAGTRNEKSTLEKLGKYKTGKSCLYIKRLSDIDLNVLDLIMKEAIDQVKSR